LVFEHPKGEKMGDGYDRVATRPRRPREISNVQDPSELNNQPSNP